MARPVSRVRTGKKECGGSIGDDTGQFKENLASQFCGVLSADLELKSSIFCVLFCASAE